MKKEKGFTLMEILAVIVILAILSTTIIITVTEYLNESKEIYDNNLEEQFLLAGKTYYSSNKNKLPGKNEDAFVSLADLRSLNVVSEDFVDSRNNKCSNKDSIVLVTNLGNGNYKYKACLICPNSTRFVDSDACSFNSFENEPPIQNEKVCEIEKIDSTFNFYNKEGTIKYSGNNYLEAIKTIVNSECEFDRKQCEAGEIEIDGKNHGFYYGENGNIYENEAAAKAVNECNNIGEAQCVITPSYYNLNGTEDGYKYIMNTTKNYSKLSSLINAFEKQMPTNINSNLTYYTHYITNTALASLKTKNENINRTPSYVSNGTGMALVNDYFSNKIKSKVKLINSTKSFVHKNKSIPSEYSLQLKNSSNVVFNVPSSAKMKWDDVKKWGKDLYSEATNGQVVLAVNSAKGKYSALYKNIGTYNGTKIDVKMELVDFGGCKLRGSANKCGLWFGNKKLEVYSLGVNKIKVKYTFYKSGTKQEIYVKGYTTYWDIDANQGIHFLKNTTGIYAYGKNQLYISTINNAPYVFEYNDAKYQGYDDAGAVTETFAGNTMTKVFTYMSGDNGNHSKITSSIGNVLHSTVPIGITISYYSGANSTSVLKYGDTLKYIIRYSNFTGSKQTIKIVSNIEGMSYVKGSSTFSDQTQKNPSISGNVLTWTKTVNPLTTGWLIYQVKVDKSYCGKLVAANAKLQISNATYNATKLSNPVICSKMQECK